MNAANYVLGTAYNPGVQRLINAVIDQDVALAASTSATLAKSATKDAAKAGFRKTFTKDIKDGESVRR